MGRGAAKEIESSKAEETNYLRTELSSLGIECKRKNEFNDYGELDALATTIKEVYFQDYKTAYSDDDCEVIVVVVVAMVVSRLHLFSI